MKHGEFRIGIEFWCGGRRWRCTDIGSRVIVAILLEQIEIVRHSPSQDQVLPRKLEYLVTDDPSWLNGPPYAIVESVFDKYDLPGCSIVKEKGAAVDPGRISLP